MLPTCAALGIGFVPWSPLGQGFLTGTVAADTTFASSDVRSRFPRFTTQAMAANRPLIELLTRMAISMHATPAQIALAWLLAQQPWIVPIPGTRKLLRLEENLGAATIPLTPADMHEIIRATSAVEIHGGRGTGQEQYR